MHVCAFACMHVCVCVCVVLRLSEDARRFIARIYTQLLQCVAVRCAHVLQCVVVWRCASYYCAHAYTHI